jgi:6-pyruvoyltetrahydropterin/6-carboxytetrahydropterin synthase
VINYFSFFLQESDVEWFKSRPSTAENVAVFIWNEMIKVMPEADQCKLYEVKLNETDTISVVYRGD